MTLDIKQLKLSLIVLIVSAFFHLVAVTSKSYVLTASENTMQDYRSSTLYYDAKNLTNEQFNILKEDGSLEFVAVFYKPIYLKIFDYRIFYIVWFGYMIGLLVSVLGIKYEN